MEKKTFQLDKKEICITSTQIKQAIDLLVDENEILQDRQYELEDRIDKAIEYIEHAQNYGKEKILYINGNDILEILKGE